MRTLLLSVFFALHLAARTGVPAAAPGPKLMVRFYTVPHPGRDFLPDPWPFSLDEPEKATRPGEVTARETLAAKGVPFPPGSSAVYLPGSALLGVKNTVENLALVGSIIKSEEPHSRIKQIAIEARLVEFRADVEGRLAIRGAFADLQKALGDGVRTVAISSLVTKSGYRGVADSGRTLPDDAKKEKSARPPAGGAVLDIQPTLSADGAATALHYTLNYSPDTAGRTAPKVQLEGTPTIRNGEIVVANTFTLPAADKRGEPRNYAVLLRCEKIGSEISHLGVEARLVEFRAGAGARLAMRGTFADLQKALGDHVRTVAATRLETKVGAQSVTNSGQSMLEEDARRSGARRQSEGFMLDTEPHICADGWTTDISFVLNYAAAVTAGRAEPRVQLTGAHLIANGEIVVANTFSLPDPDKAEPRRFAVLIRSELIDEARKPVSPSEPAPKQP